MARTRGSYNFSQNFEVFRTAPLDARQKVQYYTDLVDPSAWADSQGYVWLYKGAIVVVTEDPSSGLYWLTDAANYEDHDSWRKIVSSISGEGADGINIGDGSANVYADNDASGNLQFRTFAGSAGTTVTQVGDQIIIGIDASYSGQSNYGVNIGTGDASVYSGKVGDALEFRELSAGQNITLDVSGNLIIIDSSGGGAGSEYDNPDPVVKTVGGIETGETFFDGGKNFAETMNAMFYPTLYPSFINPFNAFGDNVANLHEIDSSINITFGATFNRGSIAPAYGTSGFRSGLPNTYHYTGTGLPASVSDTALVNNQSISGYNVLIGNQNWTSSVSYDAGEQPLDSDGNPYDSPLPAGTTGSQSTSFEGVYPLFGTTVTISTNTKQSLISMYTGNNIVFNMVAETGGNKQAFLVPTAWTGTPRNRPLQGVETYNSVSSNWEYQGGSQATSLTYWTGTSVTETIQGNIINYTKYTFNGTDRSAIDIRLKF